MFLQSENARECAARRHKSRHMANFPLARPCSVPRDGPPASTLRRQHHESLHAPYPERGHGQRRRETDNGRAAVPRHRNPCLCLCRPISGWSLCPTFFLKALRLSDNCFVTRPTSHPTGARTVPPKVPRQCRDRRFRCMARQFPDAACRTCVEGVSTPARLRHDHLNQAQMARNSDLNELK